MNPYVLKHELCAFDSVHKQQLPQTLALHGSVYCESAEPDPRHTARQLLCEILGQVLRNDLADR